MQALRITAALMLACLLLSFSGCSTLPRSTGTSYYLESQEKVDPVPFTRSQIRAKLFAQLDNWRGTAYRMGGMSRRGIDCSGFVYVTFRDHLGLTLPRSARHLAESGKRIPPEELATGDLVLFKTGLFARHVGIYVGNSRFMHVSKSEGVTLSSLRGGYWGQCFWMARRVVIPASGS